MDSVKGASKKLASLAKAEKKEPANSGIQALGSVLARAGAAAEEPRKAAAPVVRKPADLTSLQRTDVGVQLAARGNAPKSQSATPRSSSTWASGVTNFAGSGTSLASAEPRTYVEDGVTYEETTSNGRNSSEIVTRTYEQDGVSYTEVTTTQPNGDQRIVVDATQGDRTEQTTTEIRELDGNIEEHVEGDQLGAVYYDDEAERGPTTRTSSSTVVIDNSQDPPQRVVTSESTSYSQQILTDPEEFNQGGVVDLPSGVNLAGSPLSTLVDQEVEWDGQASGQTLTVTQQSQLNDQGERVENSSVTSDFRLVGTGEDDQEVVLSNTGTLVFDAEGREQHFSSVKEERGLIPRDQADRILSANMHSDADAFGDRLLEGSGEYVNFRQTYSQDLTSGEEVFVQELGDYDNPREEGRTVVSVSNGEVTSLSYRLVSDDGDRVQQQTVVPGTDYSSVSDTRYGDDGTFNTSTRTVIDGAVSESEASRELLFEEGQPLPAQAPAGYDQQQWDLFREQNPEGPVYTDQSQLESRDEDGELVERSVTEQHSAGSSSVGHIEREVDGVTSEAQLYQLGGDSPEAAIKMTDGSSATIDADGTIRIDGQVVEVDPEASGVPGALVGVGSGAQGLSQLVGVFRMNPTLAESAGASRLLGPLGTVVSLNSLVNSGSLEETTTAIAGVAGGAGGTLTAFGTAARASKALGFVGGGLTAGVGIYELTQGNYAEGAADLVAGGALIGALVLGATPAGWVLAGVAGVATAVRFFLDIGDDDGPPHAELEF